MSFSIPDFSARTGLSYDRRAKMFWGTVQRFPVFVQHPRRNTVIFTLSGSREDTPDLSGKLEKFRLAHPGMAVLQYQERTLSCAFSLPPKETVNACVQTVTELVALAADLTLQPCCTACGRPDGFVPRLLDHTGVSVCPECEQHLRADLEKIQADAGKQPPHYPGLTAAILAGGLSMFVLVYCATDLARSGYLGAYVGMMLCLFLMKKLGKKVTVPAAVTAAVLCLTACIAANVQVFSGAAAQMNQDARDDAAAFTETYEQQQALTDSLASETLGQLAELGLDPQTDLAEMAADYENCGFILAHQNTAECRRDLLAILKNPLYRSLRNAFLRYNILDLLALGVSSALMLPKMLRESRGVHTLREPAA